jgi:hypothetical protein
MAFGPEDIIVLSKSTKIFGDPSDISISGHNETPPESLSDKERVEQICDSS